jgi:hypothetical protein
LGELGKGTPRGKAFAELFAIERSAQQMSLEREELTDRAEARKETGVRSLIRKPRMRRSRSSVG